jgi:Transposase Tn5 dimerisation domain/Transposase DNA-binding
MLAPWVVEEMKGISLPDKRLNARARAVLDQLASRPTLSIPSACGGNAETTAAYRFFENERVTFSDVLQPHIDATLCRIEAQKLVIVAQDTTEIDLTRPNTQVVGTGPMDASSRRGLFLHLLHAFTPDGTALGTLHATPWTREEGAPSTSKLPSHKRVAIPIEQKESYRWVTTLEHTQHVAAQLPETQLVCVADSEADIYELLVAGMAEPRHADWIVRACHDRTLPAEARSGGESGETCDSDTKAQTLRERLLATPLQFTKTIPIRGREQKYNCEKRGRRQSRRSRTAEVEVRSLQVTLQSPQRPGGRLPDVTVNVVLVHEPNPPEGEPAVEWILLTSLPIETLDQVRKVIETYCVRWTIEVFFRTLKSGCRVEARRFEDVDHFLPCLAIYLIVTWRTLYVCRLGRELPNISCEAVFSAAEWQSVYQFVKRETPPKKPPTLKEMVRLVAQLGGYVNRKRDDEPGAQTVWLGLQRLHDIALCWAVFGPGATGAPLTPEPEAGFV